MPDSFREPIFGYPRLPYLGREHPNFEEEPGDHRNEEIDARVNLGGDGGS